VRGAAVAAVLPGLAASSALSLDDLLRRACLDPVRMMGLERKGHLTPGADADIAIVPRATGKPA
jgi:dihydroorotase-like cyclic amidohydrolase